MTMLSSSYGIIMDSAVNAPGHGNNVVYVLNEMEMYIFKGTDGTDWSIRN